MNLVIEKGTNPCRNLAREEVLLDTVTEDTIYLWRNEPSVIVGRHQNTLVEIDEVTAEAEKIQVVRRLTGGGAVFHDLGNVNFSYIFPEGDFEEKKQAGIEYMLEYLRHMGAECYPSGRNDICLRDRTGREIKVGGTAMTQRGSRGIFHGCLLFDCNLQLLERVLTPSREKLASKGVASVRARVGNLREEVAELAALSADEFFGRWAEYLAVKCQAAGDLAAKPLVMEYVAVNHPAAGDFSEEERRVEELAASRYASKEWTYGRNPLCTLINSHRFPVGTVEFYGEFQSGRIRACSFSGDFISSGDFEQLAKMLTGVAAEISAIAEVLEKIDLKKYFGTEDKTVTARFLAGIPIHRDSPRF